MSTPTRSPLDLLYVIGTYPSLTTTFIDREVTSLQRAGVRLRVVSLRRPVRTLSAEQQALVPLVRYLLPAPVGDVVRAHLRVLVRHPVRLVRLLVRLVRQPHPSWRDRLRTVAHVAEGVCVARIVEDELPARRLHAHFLDRAAVVALVVGELLDLPWTVTGHASDIYVDPVLLPAKLAHASTVATCTGYNAAHLRSLVADDHRGKVTCIPHGIDAARFAGSGRAEDPPVVLAVGQLKERKGLVHLVEACRILRARGTDFRCEIVGDGPLRDDLARAVASRGLGEVVAMRGALDSDEVRERYRAASVFALPCVLGEDGDRDGIPNVILEAMASGLPVVSTRHSGIPEAVQDGVTGLLVAPADPVDLADALQRLLDDPRLSRRLGDAGRRAVATSFDVEANVRRFRQEVLT